MLPTRKVKVIKTFIELEIILELNITENRKKKTTFDRNTSLSEQKNNVDVCNNLFRSQCVFI